MFVAWVGTLSALARGETELAPIAGAALLLPLLAWALFMFLTPKPVIEIDDEGIRSPLHGWVVSWEEVEGVLLHTMWVRGWRVQTLIVDVDDPEAVARRHRRWHRWGAKRRARVVRTLGRAGVRFALQYLDTPRKDVVAAVERYVPVEKD